MGRDKTGIATSSFCFVDPSFFEPRKALNYTLELVLLFTGGEKFNWLNGYKNIQNAHIESKLEYFQSEMWLFTKIFCQLQVRTDLNATTPNDLPIVLSK